MSVRPELKWAHWLALLAGWTALSVFFAPELYLFFVYRRENIHWTVAVLLTAANTGIAAILIPAVVWLAVRFPVGWKSWRNIAVHLGACLLFLLAHSGLYAVLCYASPVFSVLFTRFHPNLLTYWAVVGFVEAVRYFNAYNDRDRQLAHVQLQLLKAQMQPHFLFNTLNTISAMMHEDVQGADRMLNQLSELLRMTLDNIGRNETTLRNEIALVKKYFDIEKVRFGEGIRLEMDVDPEALDAITPGMILQPLVENSIRHGFRAHAQTGTIRIEARTSVGRLIVTVTDDGKGPARVFRPGGTGIPNTRARLDLLYRGAASFDLNRGSTGGAVARIEIPLRHGVDHSEETASSVRLLPSVNNANAHR